MPIGCKLDKIRKGKAGVADVDAIHLLTKPYISTLSAMAGFSVCKSVGFYRTSISAALMLLKLTAAGRTAKPPY